MDNYEFSSNWELASTPPTSGTRCIVTDGELVLFGTYVTDSSGAGVWVVTEVNSSQPFIVIGWMPSPKPMKKRVIYDEKSMENNIKND